MFVVHLNLIYLQKRKKKDWTVNKSDWENKLLSDVIYDTFEVKACVPHIRDV